MSKVSFFFFIRKEYVLWINDRDIGRDVQFLKLHHKLLPKQ